MRRWLGVAACAFIAACGSTPRRDLDYDRLHASLQALAGDPALARLALAERALAEAAVRRLDASSINAEEHAHLAYLAERRVDIAYIAAQTAAESVRLAELEREQSGLLLAASRRETAAMRDELDRQRQRELLAQEDGQRGMAPGNVASAHLPAGSSASGNAPANTPAVAAAVPAPAPPAAPVSPALTPAPVEPTLAATAPPPDSAPASVPAVAPAAAEAAPASATPVAIAAPAASNAAAPPMPAAAPVTHTENAPAVASAAADPAPVAATLAARLSVLAPDGSDAAQMTLEDLVFEPGTAQLVAEAQIGIARLAAFVGSDAARPVRIEGHTDATGSPDANRALSLRRAEAVRDALVAAGISPQRIAVSGEGSAQPVASNDEAEGRARNRRVVVRLLPPGG